MFAGRRPRCGRGAQGWTPVVPYRCEYVWYCGTDWEYSPEGAMTCEYIVKQFQDHWFPKGFKWIGHKMLLALWDKPVHRVHRIPNVHPLTRKFFEFGLKMTFLLQEKVLPDPSTPRRRRRRCEPRRNSWSPDQRLLHSLDGDWRPAEDCTTIFCVPRPPRSKTVARTCRGSVVTQLLTSSACLRRSPVGSRPHVQ